MKRGDLAEKAQQQSSGPHSANVRMAAYWLRKAIRARISAGNYPEERAAFENIAEMYEQMAERLTEDVAMP